MGNIPSVAKDCFKLADEKGELKTIERVFKTSKSMSLPFQSERTAIGGLAITGSVMKYSNDYLVRILLVDKENNEHLVMESYEALNDKSEFSFDGYCEETALLNAVYPDSIKIYVWNAAVTINNIKYRITSEPPLDVKAFEDNAKVIRKMQVVQKVNRINDFNRARKKLWRAGITDLSMRSFEEKKRIMGLPDNASTGGLEFYVEGIFEIGELEDAIDSRNMRSSTSSFVDSFDWRIQHSKNWITPNRHQGDSGYCSAFTAVAVTEAMTRLYYNQLLDIDLSEQEAACCNGSINPWKGMKVAAPLKYIRDSGVCDETAYPFVNSPSAADCRSSEVTPNELISIDGYVEVDRSEESMKEALIKHGPLASAIYFWGYKNVPNSTYTKDHAMAIVGYGQLHVGDTIYHWADSVAYLDGAFTVKEGDPHVGMTYWIYKNSYGNDGDTALNGYKHIIHYNYSASTHSTYYILPHITSMNYTDNDIICEDSDGDGYYFWGIGDKPSWCPDWVPNTKDGDDSSYLKGKLYLEAPNTIGDLEYLNPYNISTLQITENTTYNTRQSVYTNIRIFSNATLTTKDILNLFGRVTITIESGGELVIDGGVITNADIDLVAGGKLTIKNGGKLVMRTNTDFEAPIGALVEIESGGICRSNDF